MLGKLVNITTQTEEKESAKEAVSQIEILLKTASENTNNPEVFEKSVTEIETLVKQIESQKLYLNNIKKINDDLNDLKKSFYGI
jgi:phage terminase large subunit-like protein